MCARERSRADATEIEWAKKKIIIKICFQIILDGGWLAGAGAYCTPVHIILFESAHAIFIIHFASLLSQLKFIIIYWTEMHGRITNVSFSPFMPMENLDVVMPSQGAISHRINECIFHIQSIKRRKFAMKNDTVCSVFRIWIRQLVFRIRI